LIDAYIALIKH